MFTIHHIWSPPQRVAGTAALAAVASAAAVALAAILAPASPTVVVGAALAAAAAFGAGAAGWVQGTVRDAVQNAVQAAETEAERRTAALRQQAAAATEAPPPTGGAHREDLLHILEGMVDAAMQSNESMILLGRMKHEVDEANARVQSMASAVEEMVASIQEIANNSDGASTDAQHAEGVAGEGVARSRDAVSTMEAIVRSVSKAAQEVDTLAAASQEIGAIVDEIQDIADQTNLLALNATIEAARAGDAGRGFAVVANEVKNLAGQTGRATVDIRGRIEALRREMDAIVSAMKEGAAVVETGRGAVTMLGDQLGGIAEEIRHVTQRMSEISAILSQQTAASRDISQGTNDLALISTRNAQEIDTILGAMDDLSNALSDQVGSLAGLGDDALLLVAKNDHVKFKKTVLDAVTGRIQLTPDELPDHTRCRFGRWYASITDPAVRNSRAYADIRAPHEKVHAEGRRAVERALKGDRKGAMDSADAMHAASYDVIRHLDELHTILRRGSAVRPLPAAAE